jgi:hypothetical protein
MYRDVKLVSLARDECRALKTEYEIPERNFLLRRRQSKDRPLVAAPPSPTDRRRGPPARRCPRAPGALGTFATGAASQDDNVFKLAFVTFLSGPGMGAHAHSRRGTQGERPAGAYPISLR